MGGKSKAFFESLPRFIWGEALGGEPGDLDERLFLTHTRFPRFVCEVYETDEIPEIDSLDGELVGGWSERQGERIWSCNAGFFAARWAFFEAAPKFGELETIMRDAAMDYQFWNEASANSAGLDPDDF